MESPRNYVPALPFGSGRLYDVILHWTFPEDRIRRAVVEALATHSGDKVLDVGCGTGSFLAMLAEIEPDLRLVGVDPSQEMLEIARKKISLRSLELLEMKASQLHFPDMTFDRVVSSLVFHHLDEEEKALALCEIHRVLRPGGELVLADFAAPANLAMRVLFNLIRIVDGFPNTRAHLEGRLPTLISGAGFTMVRQNSLYNTLFGTVRIYSAFRP